MLVADDIKIINLDIYINVDLLAPWIKNTFLSKHFNLNKLMNNISMSG